MSRYMAKRAKKKTRVAGLMSGTSADGIDVAVVDIAGRHVDLVAFDMSTYKPALRKAILDLCRPESATLADICHYNHVLGEVFADAVIELCRQHKIRLRSIDLIGSHGQTIYHHPQGGHYQGRTIRSALQIGEPSVIAQRTGITTVADFCPRDMAAGGQGVPLVPYADYVLFRHRKLSRAVQNIGGIANVTFLPRGGRTEDVVAFDTGPGNMVIDGVMRQITLGRRSYDRDGRMAARGKVDQGLLKQMLRHPFLRHRPPKSTGREQFGQFYSEGFHRDAQNMKLTLEDMIATATAFTAATIAQAYRKFLPEMPDEVILCGGGAHNVTLVSMLQRELPGVKICASDEFGIDVDAKEAISFAILAQATFNGVANNIPSATGADGPVVLGKIVPA
jgi:anhydro-N-acetylmuramic acid kinase